MTFVIRTRECDAKSFTVDSSTIGILVRTQNYDATKVTQIFEDEIKKNLLPKPLFREVNTTLLEDMTKSSTRGCKAITVSVSNNVIVVSNLGMRSVVFIDGVIQKSTVRNMPPEYEDHVELSRAVWTKSAISHSGVQLCFRGLGVSPKLAADPEIFRFKYQKSGFVILIDGAWDLSDQDIVDYFDSDASTSNPLDTLSKYDKNCGGIVFILLSGE